MKILHIDDNWLLTDSVKKLLRSSFVVDAAHTGHDGIEGLRIIEYSLILLDLGLPDMDGLEVCRELRRVRNNTPILVLTVEKDPAVSVQLLNAGADDYVTKPFNGDVLKARISALLRRGFESREEKTVQIDDLTINVSRRQVWRSNVKIILRRKEFDILEYLMLNQGRILTRSMILAHVWGADQEGWNNTVDVHINHLRDKVDRPFDKALIKTAHGVGYMIDDSE